jgi:uncharacterized protein
MTDFSRYIQRFSAASKVTHTPESMLLEGAFAGDLNAVRKAIASGANVDVIDPYTGLAALHIAVGRNNYALARLLIEEGNARFFADRFGRWPSLVAAECRVDEALGDYIALKEAAAIAPKGSID